MGLWGSRAASTMASAVRQPTRLGAKHAALEGGEAFDEENIERLYTRLAEGHLLSAHEMQVLWKTVEGVTTTPAAAYARAEAHRGSALWHAIDAVGDLSHKGRIGK